MGKIKYSKLATVEIDHLFFENGYAPDTVPVQSELTLQSLKSLELDSIGIKTTSLRANSIAIYGEVEQEITNGNKYVLTKLGNRKVEKLTFLVFENNPYYLLRSNLPLSRPTGSCLYLTPKDTSSSGTEILLTEEEHVNWEKDNIQIFQGDFTYQFSGSISASQVVLENTTQTRQIAPSKLLKSGSKTMIVFDRRDIRLDHYKLIIDGQEVGIFFLLGDWQTSPPLAIIDIPLNENIPPAFKIYNDDLTVKSSPPVFKAVFEQRNAIWKYLVHFKTIPEMAGGIIVQSSVTDVQIISNVAQEVFETKDLNNNQYEISSKTQIAYLELPKQRLKLNYKINGVAKVRPNLPIPPSSHLSEVGGQLQTHISITI